MEHREGQGTVEAALASSASSASLALQYEAAHVHAVYDAIADHFSATRYAPWPLVARFLQAQPAGAVGLDVGCGNGKYLVAGTAGNAEPAAGPATFMLGCDRSEALARLAAKRCRRAAEEEEGGKEDAASATVASVIQADSLALPFRAASADFVICVAVVHHLSTRARRQAAVAELLRCLALKKQNEQEEQQTKTQQVQKQTPTTGRVLVYVWALEQETSRRGWTAGGAQDLLVPWVKTERQKRTEKEKAPSVAARKGGVGADGRGGLRAEKKEKTEKAEKAERAERTERTEKATAMPVPASASAPAPAPALPLQSSQPPQPPQTFQRYYHLYRQGELEEDVVAAGGHVVSSGYEKDNWWVTADVADV